MSQKTVIEQAVGQFLEHAYEGHVLGQRNGFNEFAEFGVETLDELQDFILQTLNDPETRAYITSKNGSHISFYNDRDNVFIAIEPKSGGTIHRPDLEKYPDYFDSKRAAWKAELGENFLEVKAGGLPALQEAFSNKLGHAMKIGPLARLGQAFDIAIEIAPRALGRMFKFVPLAGTAATFMIGRAEAGALREAAYEAGAQGHLPPKALEDFEVVLNVHQLQVNADVSIIGHEVKVQEAFAKFVKAYEPYFKAHPDMLEKLEPPSLAEDLFGQEMDQNVMPQWAQDYTASLAGP
ncbi:MAG: hypothetical protein R3E13_07950 [Alphaproteobacteria bacterium]